MELHVGDVVTRDVVFVDANDTVLKAADTMEKNGISSVLVLKGNEAAGIVAERDIVFKVVAKGKDSNTTLVSEIMSSPVVSVDVNLDLVEAARLMRDKKISKLLVTELNKVIGILSDRDIIEIDPALHSSISLPEE